MLQSQAEILLNSWASVVNDAVDRKTLSIGIHVRIGSLIFRYIQDGGLLECLGQLLPYAGRLSNKERTLRRLRSYADVHPRFVENASIEIAFIDLENQITEQIVLRLAYQNPPSRDSFVADMQRLSQNAYGWRKRHIVDSLRPR